MEPLKIETNMDDLIRVAQSVYSEKFQLEIKCMGLIRMLEEANAKIEDLKARKD